MDTDEINPPTFSPGSEPREKDSKNPSIPEAKPQGIWRGGGIKTEKDSDSQKEEVELVPDEETTSPDLQKKLKKLKEGLQKCETERKEYLDGWQRARADFINYKNEEGKRMEDMARFVIAGLIQDIFPVLDSFDLALTHGLPADVEKGVLLIRSQFEDILKKRGLYEIGAKPGELFDPEKHEALGEIESDFPQGSVAEVVQRGYTFRDKVLRPARVRLSKGRDAY